MNIAKRQCLEFVCFLLVSLSLVGCAGTDSADDASTSDKDSSIEGKADNWSEGTSESPDLYRVEDNQTVRVAGKLAEDIRQLVQAAHGEDGHYDYRCDTSGDGQLVCTMHVRSTTDLPTGESTTELFRVSGWGGQNLSGILYDALQELGSTRTDQDGFEYERFTCQKKEGAPNGCSAGCGRGQGKYLACKVDGLDVELDQTEYPERTFREGTEEANRFGFGPNGQTINVGGTLAAEIRSILERGDDGSAAEHFECRDNDDGQMVCTLEVDKVDNQEGDVDDLFAFGGKKFASAFQQAIENLEDSRRRSADSYSYERFSCFETVGRLESRCDGECGADVSHNYSYCTVRARDTSSEPNPEDPNLFSPADVAGTTGTVRQTLASDIEQLLEEGTDQGGHYDYRCDEVDGELSCSIHRVTLRNYLTDETVFKIAGTSNKLTEAMYNAVRDLGESTSGDQTYRHERFRCSKNEGLHPSGCSNGCRRGVDVTYYSCTAMRR